MLRGILVPLDGSSLAEVVLPWLRMLVRLTGAEVSLLQVVEPSDIGDASSAANGAAAEEQARSRAHTYLIGIAQELQHAGITVHTQVTIGRAADVIVSMAEQSDLIAMATHGRSGIGRWVFGSVADKVLQAAPVPVFLVRAAEQAAPEVVQAPRRIVVPLDGSALAEQALPLAVQLAKQAGAELRLVQSIHWAQLTVADFPAGYYAGAGAEELITRAEEDAKTYLDGVRQSLAEQSVAATMEVRFEPAADAILTYAEEQNADLIVMSTHGRGGLGRWAFGSVADRVLQGSRIPLLVVRSDEEHEGNSGSQNQ